MKFTLNELRQLIKETISETYLGTSTAGSLASTAFNRVGPNDNMGVPIPIDPVDLAEQIRALMGFEAGYPIGDWWGDESLNAAAEAAADALINNSQREKTTSSVRLYEQKQLMQEQIKKARNILSEELSGIHIERLADALNTIIELLNSMDMSLDLVYGAVSGHEGPISAIRGLQKSYGRAMSPRLVSGDGEG